MKFKKIKYFKNFLSNLDFNFDTLTDILNTSELHQYIKAEPTDTINFRKVFDHIYQVKRVETTSYLNPVYNLLIDKTKNYFTPGDFDLFISFKAVKGVCSSRQRKCNYPWVMWYNRVLFSGDKKIVFYQCRRCSLYTQRNSSLCVLEYSKNSCFFIFISIERIEFP